MKSLAVALDLTCDSCSLGDLERLAGCSGSEGSFDRGSVRASGRTAATSRLLVSSGLGGTDIEEHLVAIRGKLAGCQVDQLPADIQVTLDIAVFFETAMTSIDVPLASLETLPITPKSLVVTCYPASEEEPGSER